MWMYRDWKYFCLLSVCVCACARKGKRDLHTHHLESLISPVTVRPERGNQGLRCYRADVVTHCDDCCKKCHSFCLKRLYLLPYQHSKCWAFICYSTHLQKRTWGPGFSEGERLQISSPQNPHCWVKMCPIEVRFRRADLRTCQSWSDIWRQRKERE